MSPRLAGPIATGAVVLAGVCAAPPALAAGPTVPAPFTISVFSAAPLTTPATNGADDIARLDGRNFVVYSNGTGKTGCKPTDVPPCVRNDSSVIEFGLDGAPLATFSLIGHTDGIAADPQHHRLIVTVNEDGNSSLYTISPGAATPIAHFTYSPVPDALTLPTGGLSTGGGTDAVSVDRQGTILLSASNPGPIDSTAVFKATLSGSTATLTPTFADNAAATNALTGAPVTLGLTDPDSNALVPQSSRLFGGQFMLDGQADQQLVFARHITTTPVLTQLPLNQGGTPAGVDDVQWTHGADGTLFVVDSATNIIYAVKGPFRAGQAFAALDTVGAAAKTSEVDALNLATGTLTPFVTGLGKAKGLIWDRPAQDAVEEGGDGGEGQRGGGGHGGDGPGGGGEGGADHGG